ncbi:MAG: ribosome silencing factor [Bradymonadales bacterium]|nr:ribosome silencing factor [Bradymonadales bacterium]
MKMDSVVHDTKREQKPDSEQISLPLQVAEAAWDKKAMGLTILDMRGLVSYTDFFVICSGNTDRQVRAIVDAIQETLYVQGERPIGVEGRQEGRWVLMDYGDVVIHVFADPERDVYALESIWSDAPTVPIETPAGLERPSTYLAH